MMKRLSTVGWIATLATFILTSGAHAAEDLDLGAAIDAVRPACVRIEYTLRYDNGEAPQSRGWRERCPNCGGYHGGGSGEQYVKQKRPKVVGGFLLSSRVVLSVDPQIHPRFIERIAVRAGEQLVPATISAYPTKQNGVLLELEEPLTTAQPLAFDASAPGPYCAVTYRPVDAQFAVYAEPLSSNIVVRDDGEQMRAVPAAAVIVNGAGVPVGATMNSELPADDSWKGSPLEWPALDQAEMTATLARLAEVTTKGLLPVTLKFRSPKRDKMSHWGYSGDDDKIDTELRTVGVLVDEDTLLIPADLKPTDTARLEHIQIPRPDGETITAEFGFSLRELGCLTAKLAQPLDGALQFDTGDIRELRNELAFAVEYKVFGDSHIKRVMHARVPSFSHGHNAWVFPSIASSEECSFLLRPDGTLCATRAIIRSLGEERWWSDDPVLVPSGPLATLLADPTASADVSNVPLSIEQENRVAWLGIEMQSLDAELARVNNVSEYTQNGATGVIVSYVYEGSPASDAGVKPGDILLRLHLEDRPKPVDVTAAENYMTNFPWDRLDEVPEEYFEQIPQPWPPVENNLTKTLTKAGIGRKYRAEFFIDGEIVMKEFNIVESPPHYDSAPRVESESLGITVRDLTYEVRRYFQKQDDEFGIIVSKVEPGSKASVAGVRPYELITHLNDQPVADVAAFEQLLDSAEGELRLNVKRMAQGRVVKIKLPEAAAADSAPEDPEEDG